jgi:MFS family permease
MRNEQSAAFFTPDRVRVLLALPILIGSLDMTMITAFVSDISITLNIDPGAVGMIVTGYLITYTLALFLAGRISDYIGRRLTFAIAMGLYISGSALIFAFPWLVPLGVPPLVTIILGRVITGAGAGAVPSLAISVMCDLYPKPLRPIGFIGAVDILGVLAGGLYGAIVVQVLPWRSAFLISIAIGALALIATYRALSTVRTSTDRFDWPSALLIGFSLSAFTLGIAQLEQFDFRNGTFDALVARILPFMIAALVAAIAFLVWANRSPQHRLYDLSVFRRVSVIASVVVSFLSSIGLFTMLVGLPLLANVYVVGYINIGVLIPTIQRPAFNRAALQAGLLIVFYAGSLAVATAGGARLAERIGTARTVIVGLALAVIGFGAMRFAIVAAGDIPIIAATSVIAGAGLGLIYSPIFDKPLAATTNPSAMASLLLAIRMFAGTCVVTIFSVVAKARVNYLVCVAQKARIGVCLPALLSYKTYSQASIQMISEMAIFAFAFCVLALIPALWLRPPMSRTVEATTSDPVESSKAVS